MAHGTECVSVCVCVCLRIPAGAMLHVRKCACMCAYTCVCMCVCVCCQQAGGLCRPVKVMCGGYLESGRGRLAHCSPLIFYMAALSSLIIFYTAAITNCLEKKGPPATAHAASSKTRHTHKHTPAEARFWRVARQLTDAVSTEHFHHKEAE